MKTKNQLHLLIPLFISFSIISCISSDKDYDSYTMEAIQFRIARPTHNLKEIVKFYKEGLGFKVLGELKEQQESKGIMLGLPGYQYHLEFTRHPDHENIPEPTEENSLVFYFDSSDKYENANRRLQAMNIRPIESKSSYLKGKSQTYEDPDKWKIVLYNGTYHP